jgi:hypothetical protein
VLAVAALLCAVAGFAIGRGGGEDDGARATATAPPRPPVQVAAGPLRLAVPADWRRDPGLTASALGIDAPVGLRAAAAPGAGVVAGLVRDPAPTLLSAEHDPAAPAGSAETVRLGDLEALRYRDVRLAGQDGAATVFAVPTPEGAATIACLRADAPRVARACEAAAASARVDGTTALTPGEDEDYERRLAGTLGATRTQARRVGAALRDARTARGQARLARELASVNARAAQRLADATEHPSFRRANTALVAALRRTGSAYRALGAAAGDRSRRAHGQAREDARRGERAVRAALRRLAAAAGPADEG